MSSAPHPPLTDHAQAEEWLTLDPALAEVIARIGPLPVLMPTPDPFGTLIRSVVGQQVSTAAARSIHGRLVDGLGEVTPRALLQAEPETLRSHGLSWAKVRTVRALAEAAVDGRVDFGHLASLPDEAVIAALTPLPGIGRWTVEMFLMFALARPDVFSFGDLALRQALMRFYPDAVLADVSLRWSPYRTLAARYLWAEATRLRSVGKGEAAPL